MTPNPTATETTVTTRSLATLRFARTGSMRCETAGSPTQPNAREATVMPTWQTERFESRSSSVSRTTPARAPPPSLAPRAPLLLELHDARLADADQGELRGDEERVEAHQDGGRQEV